MKKIAVLSVLLAALASRGAERHLLYVANPGIRNYQEYGGHGLVVYDIADGYKFVRRIALAGLDAKGQPWNVKGICASAETGLIHVSTPGSLTCIDLVTEKILWEKKYEGGCDRMSLTRDGKEVYLPSYEKDHWHVVDARSGEVIRKIPTPGAGAHNTVVDATGKHAYLCGLKSPVMRVVDTQTREVVKEVGPFTSAIRPFTVSADGGTAFVNVNGLIGFEVGDIATGKKTARIEVPGYKMGPVKRHGCPSHGIGMTPDGKELWVCDAHNKAMHVFDSSVMPPVYKLSVALRDEPGWITFSIDGKTAWPSTGDVVDVATHKIITTLRDEEGRAVQSEKLLEIVFDGSKPVRAGDQFGRGLRR